jgi:triosephosphate isomerase
VMRQIIQGLDGIPADQVVKIVVAYEPVWAIGTGRAATAGGANAVIAENIRIPMAALFGAELAQGTRVLYGGSVNGANAEEFFGQPDIDGALVGGASLKAEFIKIVEAAGKK